LKPHFLLTLLHFRILSVELVSLGLPSNLKNNPLKYQQDDISDSKVSLTIHTQHVKTLLGSARGTFIRKFDQEMGSVSVMLQAGSS